MSYDLRIAVKVDGAEKGNEYAVIAEEMRLGNNVILKFEGGK